MEFAGQCGIFTGNQSENPWTTIQNPSHEILPKLRMRIAGKNLFRLNHWPPLIKFSNYFDNFSAKSPTLSCATQIQAFPQNSAGSPKILSKNPWFHCHI
jgi:hypothetical protein